MMQTTTDHLTKSLWFIASSQLGILKYVQVILLFRPLLVNTSIYRIISSKLIVTQHLYDSLHSNKNGKTTSKESYIEFTIESIPCFVLGFSLKLIQKPSLSSFISQFYVLIPDHEDSFFCPLQV